MSENILISSKLSKLFIKYTIPAVIAMIIAGMQNMVDGLFVGNFLGPDAMASVNIAMPFTRISIGLSMVISIGCQSFIGLKLGEKNYVKAKNTFKTFLWINIILTIVISIIGFIYSHQLAELFGANSELIDGTATYIKTYSLFMMPLFLMFFFGFLNRVIERPDLYFKGTVFSLCVNICLNYLLIVRLGLGMKGAAIATGMAYSSALLIVVWPMLNKNNDINIYDGKFEKATIAPVLYNGSSEGVNAISLATTTFLFNRSLLKIAGASGVAAFTSISYIGEIGMLLSFGISDGIGPIISYNYGAGVINRVKKTLKSSYLINFTLGALIFILLFFFGENIIEMFIKDNPNVVGIASHGAKIYAFAFLAMGYNIINSGYFTYIGKGLESAVVAASRGLIFIIIGIFALPYVIGINGVWLTIPFAEWFTFVVGTYLLKKNKMS